MTPQAQLVQSSVQPVKPESIKSEIWQKFTEYEQRQAIALLNGETVVCAMHNLVNPYTPFIEWAIGLGKFERIDRTNKRWGNPFEVQFELRSGEDERLRLPRSIRATSRYATWLLYSNDDDACELRASLPAELSNKALGCLCKDGMACHGNLLAEIANKARKTIVPPAPPAPKPVAQPNEEQQNAIDLFLDWFGDKNANPLFELSGSAGCGKLQPYDAKVLTPWGFVQMRDIVPGSVVMTGEGVPSQVLQVFPGKDLNMYRVTFSDGSTVECCEDHLWRVQTPKQRIIGTFRVLPLKEMLSRIDGYKTHKKKGHFYSVDNCQPIEFEPQEVPVDPYLLGWLIGDGYLPDEKKQVAISVWERDAEEVFLMLSPLMPKGIVLRLYEPSPSNLNVQRLCFPLAFKHYLAQTGLVGKKSPEKFVPDIYKYNSVEVRKAILAGLLDTDSHVKQFATGKVKIRFSSYSKQLAEDVRELVLSLGGNTSISVMDRAEKGIEYCVSVRLPFNPFRLRRRRDEWAGCKQTQGFRRFIVSAEYIGKKDGQCILIDHPSHLYVTDNYIVTHNTFTLSYMLKEAGLRYADVILAAPCNKAAFVLQQALFEAGLPRFECKTIHSALGIKIADYDEKGQPIFDTKKGNRKNIENLKLLIIDEKSMIDRGLYESIHTLAPDGLKILLCGDSFQLPPVVKTVPLILSHEEYDRASVSGFTDPFSLSPAIGCAIPEQSATLQRIMRQDGGCCVELLKSIRLTISEADEFMRQLHQDPNGQWTFTPSLSLFQEERDHSLQEYETKSAFLKKAIELFREQKRAKVIAYKNSTVNYFQSQIFKSLFPDTTTPYPVGLYIQLKEHWRNGGNTIVVPAGCEGYVTEATLQKAYFAGSEVEYHNLAVDFGELFGTVNLKVPTAESATHIKNAIDVIQATMQRDSGVEYTPDMSLKSLYTRCKLEIEIDSMPTLAQAIGFSHGNIAQEQGTIVFQLMQMGMIKTSWKQGWSFVYSLKSSFAEVENGYASTVYKGQGSTYSEVLFYNDMPRFQINPWQLDRNAIDLLKVKGKIDAAKKSLKSKRGQSQESFKFLVWHEFEQYLPLGTVPKDWDFEEWQTAIEFKLNELLDVSQYLEAYTRKTQGMDPRVCLRALYVAASRHKASLHFFDASKDFE